MRLTRLKWIPRTVVVAAAMAACSSSAVQTSLAAQAKTHQAPAHQVTAPPATARPDAAPIGVTGPVVGVNLYAVHDYSAAQTAADGTRTLRAIRR